MQTRRYLSALALLIGLFGACDLSLEAGQSVPATCVFNNPKIFCARLAGILCLVGACFVAGAVLRPVAGVPLFSSERKNGSDGDAESENAETPLAMWESSQERTLCTVEQLLPNPNNGAPGGWSDGRPEEYQPEYDCSCPYYKARYYCPEIPNERPRPVWKPHAVANGDCQAAEVRHLHKKLLPDGYTVFAFANSHGRQIMQSLLCRFSDQIVERNVTVSDTPWDYQSHRQETISLESQCRGMSTSWKEQLVSNGCIGVDDKHAFKCKDDRARFSFKNGASFNYRFSDVDNQDKDADREMADLGLKPEGVDVVLLNSGNGAELPLNRVLNTANKFRGSRALLLWLTMFSGRGYYRDGEKQRKLEESNVIQVDLGLIGAAGHVQEWRTKMGPGQAVTHDHHFCMPGPADEMALLIVQMVWAHYFETRARNAV